MYVYVVFNAYNIIIIYYDYYRLYLYPILVNIAATENYHYVYKYYHPLPDGSVRNELRRLNLILNKRENICQLTINQIYMFCRSHIVCVVCT